MVSNGRPASPKIREAFERSSGRPGMAPGPGNWSVGDAARRALASIVFGIWSTIFFAVETGPACGGIGSG